MAALAKWKGKGKGVLLWRDGRARPVDPGIPTLQREEDEVTPRDDLERVDTPSCNGSCVIEENSGEN